MLLFPLAKAQGMEPAMDEIETLDMIEIKGEVVEQAPRDLKFPTPALPTHVHLNRTSDLLGRGLSLVKSPPTQSRILLDQTAKTINLHTPVKPLKTEHPAYPRKAREQGWQGRAIIRMKILPDGTVESGTIHQSTGHQLLDDNAISAAKQWTFEPAKNGGFPVATTVNIPIQFDLVQ